MNSNIMYFWHIYDQNRFINPIGIEEGFNAFRLSLFECAQHLKPGNSVCYFRPFAVMGQPITVAQARQTEMMQADLSKLHFQFFYRRSFFWTIAIRPVIDLGREWEDYRVIATITRVT